MIKKLLSFSLLCFVVACSSARHEGPAGGEEEGNGQPPVASAPGGEQEGSQGEEGDCIPEGMELVDFGDVQSEIFGPACATCHSAQGGNPAGINLESFSTVKANLERAKDSIDNNRMPIGSPLSNEQKNLLAAWMNLGAPESIDDITLCE